MSDQPTRPRGGERGGIARWMREHPRQAILVAMAALLAVFLVRTFTGDDPRSLMERTDRAKEHFALVVRAQEDHYARQGSYTDSVAELSAREQGVAETPEDATLELALADGGDTVAMTLEGSTVLLGAELSGGIVSSESCEILRRRAGIC